jgi:DNA-binding MltR family transcriptional regulator
MSKQKPKNPTLTPDALSGNIDDFFKAINHENDLACALVTTSYLEQCLATLLRQFFIEKSSTADTIFDHTKQGVLTEISSRSKLAYCLGLIDNEIFINLGHIGSIRNRFAHTHPELTFGDSDVKALCEKLTLPRISGIEVNETTSIPLTQERFEENYKTPKGRYTLIATLTATSILLTALKVDRCQPKSKEPSALATQLNPETS